MLETISTPIQKAIVPQDIRNQQGWYMRQPSFLQMKPYKPITILLLLIAFLSSCTSQPSDQQENPASQEQSQKTKSAGEIVNQYVNTLTTAKDKAKKAADAASKRAEEENKAIQEEEK